MHDRLIKIITRSLENDCKGFALVRLRLVEYFQSMTDAKLAELMKRNRQLTTLIQQRELTQAEKDEWEEVVRQIQELQEGEHLGAEDY